MSEQSSNCSEDRLRGLLRSDDDFGDDHQLAVKHLAECQRCQVRLEELAAEPDAWSEARESLLSGDDLDTGRRAAMSGRPWARRRWQHRTTAWTESMSRQLLSPPSHPEMLGRIGRYEVERLIGAGGMGVVFKAFDTELNRPVAVKMLAPILAGSGAARQRFAREARAAAAVVHEHVVSIHNVETEGESPFLVMQYVAGESLQGRLDHEGALDVCEILRIGMQTAAGLAAAHAQGLVHRDVKPSNILLEKGVERAMLTDFGLARASDDASLTHTGFHPGTPQYMSPEQARGDGVDARSDLFSLGSVFYTMCTGRAPFRAETSYGILRRITDTEPRSIREINPNIPDWLCGIIAKLMAKGADDRFASAAEVAELLEDWLAHSQQPTTVPLPESCRSLVERHNEDQQTAAGPRFPRKPPFSALRLVVGAAVALSLLFAGILIVLELNKGTLTIESEADDVPIRIMQGEADVERLTVTRSGASIRVTAGTYMVEIDGELDGIKIENGSVELRRREKRVVRIVQSREVARDADQGNPDGELQILLSGPPGAEVKSNRSNTTLKLPGRLSIRGRRVDFTLSRVPERVTVYGALHREPFSELAERFLEQHAVSLEITQDDLLAASHGTLTKYIYLPQEQSHEKWAGHFGTLTMGSVDEKSDAAVRKNLGQRGELLVVCQLWDGSRNETVPGKIDSPKTDEPNARVAEWSADRPISTGDRLSPIEAAESSQALDVGFPSDAVLQEMHDLLSEETQLKLDLRYVQQFLEGGKLFAKTDAAEILKNARRKDLIEARQQEITNRLKVIHESELGDLRRVAENAGLECSEEPLYGQTSYGVIVYAQTLDRIQKDELLLFHAGSLYRTRGTIRPLRTTGNGFFLRPNVAIPSGRHIALSCIQDAEEERENVKNGFMPDSNRARNPSRAYRANVYDRQSGELIQAEQAAASGPRVELAEIEEAWTQRSKDVSTMPKKDLDGAVAVIDKESFRIHVPSQKGPHPHWRYALQADGGIDLREADQSKAGQLALGKYELTGTRLNLAINATYGDTPRPADAIGYVPQAGVQYLVLARDDHAVALPILDDLNPKREDALGAQQTDCKTLNQLQGKWRLTRQIADDGNDSITPSNATWEFKGNRMVARDSGGGGAMIVTIDESHSPIHVDVELETEEETGLGLLSVEGDLLKVCLGKSQKVPDPRSRPEKLKAVRGAWYMELRRMKPGESIEPSQPRKRPPGISGETPNADLEVVDPSTKLANASTNLTLAEICSQAHAALTSIETLQYRFDKKDDQGWHSQAEFYADPLRFRVNRKDLTGIMGLDDDLKPIRNPPMTISSAFDGQKQQYARQNEPVRIKHGREGGAYGITIPQVWAYGWLRNGAAEFHWDTILSKELWEQRFQDAIYIGDVTEDGRRFEIVDFPQRLEQVTPCIYRVYFARDLAFLPLKIFRNTLNRNEPSTTVHVTRFKTFTVNGKQIAIPLVIQHRETQADGVSHKGETTITVDEGSLRVNYPLDDSLFALNDVGDSSASIED